MPKKLAYSKFEVRSVFFVGCCLNTYIFWRPEDRKFVYTKNAEYMEQDYHLKAKPMNSKSIMKKKMSRNI